MGLLREVSGEGDAAKGYGTAADTDVDLELKMPSILYLLRYLKGCSYFHHYHTIFALCSEPSPSSGACAASRRAARWNRYCCRLTLSLFGNSALATH